jgi:Putative transposase
MRTVWRASRSTAAPSSLWRMSAAASPASAGVSAAPSSQASSERLGADSRRWRRPARSHRGRRRRGRPHVPAGARQADSVCGSHDDGRGQTDDRSPDTGRWPQKDHVFPDVPVRQWVLSVPFRLRYQLAWDHDLCRAVVGVLLGAVGRVLRARARDEGVEEGRGGGVAVIQRFGGALNLNVHIHALVLDGVFAKDGTGALRFHPTPNLTTLDVAEVLATVESLMARRLRGRGRGEREADCIRGMGGRGAGPGGTGGCVRAGTTALGPSRGARLRRLGDAVEPVETSASGPCHARANGFDLHAGLVVPAGQRERLERIVRYALRPPVAQERLHC